MIVVKTIAEMKDVANELKRLGKTIGFVPTMGYFHEGHLSLMKAAKSKGDYLVVSIFVNPTQFGPNEDFESYPRDLERDLALCREEGVDLVFAPSVEEMYPSGYSTYVIAEGEITNVLCGASRPGHFKGVTSVVAKLFNIVRADFAYFGQKDAQQVAVVEKMVRDLNFNVTIVPCPIVRELDGLAMSSRNVYLDEGQRQQALVLSKALERAKHLISQGERSTDVVLTSIRETIEGASDAVIDYVQILNAEELSPLELLSGDVLIAIAVKFGKTRLIDNQRLIIPGGNHVD